jgi:hypothetical protein
MRELHTERLTLAALHRCQSARDLDAVFEAPAFVARLDKVAELLNS